jgi:hypothetical protein
MRRASASLHFAVDRSGNLVARKKFRWSTPSSVIVIPTVGFGF